MPDTFELFRDVLANAYDDRARARIVVERAGIPAYAQPLDQPDMLTWWWQTLRIAWRRGVLVALLEAAIADPAVDAWRADLEMLRAPVAQLQRQPAPPGEVPGARAVAPVLFDEGHGQGSWNASKPIASSGYQEAEKVAEALAGASCERNRGKLSAGALAGRRVVILPIGPMEQTKLAEAEIAALDDFIGRGGGLLVLSTYCGDAHHHANLNDLLKKHGILCNADTVMPREMTDSQVLEATHADEGPGYAYLVEATPDDAGAGDPAREVRKTLLAGVTSVLALAPCSLSANPSLAASILRSKDGSWLCTPDPFEVQGYLQRYPRKEQQTASVVAAILPAEGRVVVTGSWRMFDDKFMRYAGCDNARLYRNIVTWLLAAH